MKTVNSYIILVLSLLLLVLPFFQGAALAESSISGLIPKSCRNVLDGPMLDDLSELVDMEVCGENSTGSSSASFSEYSSILKDSISECKAEEGKFIRSRKAKKVINILEDLPALSLKEHWDGVSQLGFHLEDEDVDLGNIFKYTSCVSKASLDHIDSSEEKKERALSLIENNLKERNNFYVEGSSAPQTFRETAHIFTQIALLLEGEKQTVSNESSNEVQLSTYSYEEVLRTKESLDFKEEKALRGCYAGELLEERDLLTRQFSNVISKAAKESGFCSSKQKGSLSWPRNLSNESCEIVSELARLDGIENRSKSSKSNFEKTLGLLESAKNAKLSGVEAEAKHYMSEAEGRFNLGCSKEFRELAELVREGKSENFQTKLAELKTGSLELAIGGEPSARAPLARLKSPDEGFDLKHADAGTEFDYQDTQAETEEGSQESYASILDNCELSKLEDFIERNSAKEFKILEKAKELQSTRQSNLLLTGSLGKALESCDKKESASLFTNLSKEIRKHSSSEQACLKKEASFSELEAQAKSISSNRSFSSMVDELDSLTGSIEKLEKNYDRASSLNTSERNDASKIINKLSSYSGACSSGKGISNRAKNLARRVEGIL